MGGSIGIIEAQLAADFDRVRVIAHSGAATVLAAVQRSTGRLVAVKAVRSSIWLDDPASSPEVAAHAEMSWHPHVATLFDAGRTSSGLLWLSMEHAATTLQARLERKPVPPAELLRIAEELTGAVAAMHARGIVHSDLKPSNILLAQDGGVRVSDFGIAQRLNLTPPTLDPAMGTIQYAAPEVLDGARSTTSSDVWGIGATLWAAAHGRPPFGSDHRSLGTAMGAALGGFPAWDPPSEFAGPEADRLAEIVSLCTRPEPTERPTAAELAGLVARPIHQRRPLQHPPPPDPVFRRARLWGSIALVAIVTTAGAAFALRDDGRGPTGLINYSTPEFCDAVAQADKAIGATLNKATRTLIDGGYTAKAMRSALGGLPSGVAMATEPWRRMIAREPEFSDIAGQLTETSIRDLIVAEAATYLATGRFIGAGTATSDELTLRGLPPGIAATAAALGEVSARARTSCGSEGVSWRDAQIGLVDAVAVSLKGPDSRFFADPVAAAKALDADLLVTVVTVQRGYFVRLVLDHPEWLIEVTDPDTGSPAVTSMLLGEGATAFYEIAMGSPEVARYLVNDNEPLLEKLLDTLPKKSRYSAHRQLIESQLPG